MDAIWQAISPGRPGPEDYMDLEFWIEPERVGWLSKQGEYIRTWRRRWFVLKRGKLLWFKDPADVTPTAVPRGVVQMGRCQTVKGAEDIINKPYSLQLYVDGWPTYLVAETEKEKEEWINSIGRAIVQQSGAVTPDFSDYHH